MTTSLDQDHEFLDRFETLRAGIRRVRIATALCLAVTAGLALVAVAALFDYEYELAWRTRAAALGALAALVAGWLVVRVCQIVVRWSRPRTAAELEERFPELGQQFRTAVQYGRHEEAAIVREGLAPSLVAALESDTSRRTQPLAFDAVVPTARLLATAATAILAAVALFGSMQLDWEWRTAVSRALLAETPYTTLAVTPGHADVDEGGALAVTATLSGRTDRRVLLQSRPAGQPRAAWAERTVEPTGSDASGSREISFAANLSKIVEPLEYRVVAGPVASEVFRIDVRYPLAVTEVAIEVQPPEYTGLPASAAAEPDITALHGSRARFRVELDRSPVSAEVVARRVGALEEGEEREFRIPLEPAGATLAWEMNLTRDLRWSIDARSRDGTRIRENAFRIRVREDQPPRVGFESPDELLEVHTLAEVLMRIRATDDYGLTRAGIVFQINNNEEHTLLEEDFAEVAAAAAELEQTGQLAPRTRSLLERVLPLESFALTQKDCLIYYAFAEDNFPDGPHRTESDLRFVDIRPFKQTFRLVEPGEPGGGGGREFTSLEELIYRQRGILNSTLRLDRRPERASDRDLGTVDRLMAAQSELANLTRELAEFLISEGADDIDMFFQAEAAMLNAVDSLSVGKYDTAALLEKDAQQYLVEARNALVILLADPQNAALRRALARFNRALRQKLRRNREQDDSARTLVERLAALANTEAAISRELAALSQSMQRRAGAGAGSTPAAEQQPAETENGEPSGEPPAGENSPAPSPDPGEPMPENAAPAANAPDPRDLEDRQYDALAEAQEIAEGLAGLDGVTELATDRMQAAVQRADEAAGTLARGDTDESARQTAEAAGMFGELASHLAALLAEEAPERVAMARNMAAGLADRERQLADELTDRAAAADRASRSRTDADQPAGAGRLDLMAPEPQADQLAERARTLDDVLTAIARSPRVEDSEAADRVAELLTTQKVPEALQRVQELPALVRDTARPLPAAVAEIGDTAERMDVAARELDRIFRSLVAPRIEQLRDLEERTVEIEQRMNRLETTAAIQEWQQRLEMLLDDLEQFEAGGGVREELSQKARDGELPAGDAWTRGAGDRYFGVPAYYRGQLPLLVAEVQQQIQEIVLADLLADRDEPTPPEYEHLVQRYLAILGAVGGGGNQEGNDE